MRGPTDMGLKAPSILTFMLSVVLTVVVMIMKLFGAVIPFLTGHEFWVLFAAQVILIVGCMTRAL